MTADRLRRSTMTRALRAAVVCLAAVAALLATSVPSQAATLAGEDQRAHVFRLSFTGFVLEAAWSTCPDLPSVPLGTLCRSTDVTAFLSADHEQAAPEVNLHNRRGPTVKVFESECRVVDLDGERGCAPVRERFGRTETAAVTVDPRLGSGSAVADVPVQVWTPDEEGAAEGVMSVHVSWTGVGPLGRIAERQQVSSPSVTVHSTTRGWQRACTAAAAVDRAPVVGDPTWCSELRLRQGELSVFRGL